MRSGRKHIALVTMKMLVVEGVAFSRKANGRSEIIIGNSTTNGKSTATGPSLPADVGVLTMPANKVLLDFGAVIVCVAVTDFQFCNASKSRSPAASHCRLIDRNLMILNNPD